MPSYVTCRPSQTGRLASFVAKQALAIKPEKALVFALTGQLGGGKTTFLQGFAQGLGLKEKILSPTFVLMKKFSLSRTDNFTYFFHLDCYRILNIKAARSLGLSEIFNGRHVVAIEWADRVRSLLPPDTIWVNFELINRHQRKITITNNNPAYRLPPFFQKKRLKN